jgi:hypothetical protein
MSICFLLFFIGLIGFERRSVSGCLIVLDLCVSKSKERESREGAGALGLLGSGQMIFSIYSTFFLKPVWFSLGYQFLHYKTETEPNLSIFSKF